MIIERALIADADEILALQKKAYISILYSHVKT